MKTTLGEVCAPVATLQPSSTPSDEFTYFDIGGIDNETNRIAETKTVTGREAPSRARQVARTGDILFSTVRTYLKKIARIDRDYPNPVASTGFTVIRAAEGVSSQFLFFRVLSEDFLQPLHALQSGSSYPAVRDKDVFAQPIPLPPSREQERIVAKLDALLSRVAAGEAAARRALERLKRYRAAVLHAAVTGELTRDWRKTHKPDETGAQLLKRLLQERRALWEEAELKRLHAAGKPPKDDKWKRRYLEPELPKPNSLPKLPRGWASVSIDQLGWTSGYGTSVKCTYEAKGPAVLRIPNIRNRELDFADLKFATNSKDVSEEDFVTPGDLLLIRTNGSVDLIGRAAIAIATPQRKCSFASYLIRFRLVGDESLWSWVSLTWGSDVLRLAIRSRAATTAGQYNVSLSGLADLPLPLPPLAEQEVIVREVESRLMAADRLVATLNRQLDRARTTRQSLLREAFAGKLIPQDPKDEPASVLLERIRAAREAEATKPKAKRMPKPKSTIVRRSLLEV
ncbi:MAG: restriction endonuclease subunit S, partial [FCB group bacterium]|nr:restriction endonuclease subunit S [FCB group bacterium]